MGAGTAVDYPGNLSSPNVRRQHVDNPEVLQIGDMPVTYRDETVISEEHLRHIQEYAAYLAALNEKLGYNISHNNCYREKAAVALDQQIYPDLGIVHNIKATGSDATDKFGRTREYKKVELGPGSKKPFERQYKVSDGTAVLQGRKGSKGFQPSKIGFQLTRFREKETQEQFLKNDALVISLFFAEVALPSVSYVIRSNKNLEDIVVFFNQFLYNTPTGTNKWSHNNVRIPLDWILTELDPEFIDVIVMVEGSHRIISVKEHNEKYVGLDLTPTGFLLDNES